MELAGLPFISGDKYGAPEAAELKHVKGLEEQPLEYKMMVTELTHNNRALRT